MDTELATLNTGVLILEVIIAVVIVALLVGIIVTTRRRQSASAPKPAVDQPNFYAGLQEQPSGRPDPFGRFAASSPVQAGIGTPASAPSPVYAGPGSAFPPESTWPGGLDLAAATNSPAGNAYAPAAPAQDPAATWPSDPWSSGSSGALHADPHVLDSQPAPVAVAPAPVTPAPPPGTPAGWLPDPSGSTDTLRYWDGNAWTQHFAQRS
ncbi:MAG: DUF2510 domain-containing protein [Acidimicrobiales bacterium]